MLRLGTEDTELLPELERAITAASGLLDEYFGAMVQRISYHNAAGYFGFDLPSL